MQTMKALVYTRENPGEAKNKQLVFRLETQEKIIHQTLENANKQNDVYLTEINRLRGELDGT